MEEKEMRRIKILEERIVTLEQCNKWRLEDVTKLWKVIRELKEDVELIKKEKND